MPLKREKIYFYFVLKTQKPLKLSWKKHVSKCQPHLAFILWFKCQGLVVCESLDYSDKCYRTGKYYFQLVLYQDLGPECQIQSAEIVKN